MEGNVNTKDKPNSPSALKSTSGRSFIFHKDEDVLSNPVKHHAELREFKSTIALPALLCGTLGLAFLMSAAFIARSMDSNLIPYVVTVDTHGVVRNEGLLTPESNYMKSIPQSVISAQLCNFITDMRMVTIDKNLQKKAISHVFACLKRDSKVFSELQNTYEKSNPLNPKDKQEVKVEIANVIPLDKYTYQIDWVEMRSAPDAIDTQSNKMRALISYEISAGYYQDPNLLMQNPLNLFIKELVVSPIIAQP